MTRCVSAAELAWEEYGGQRAGKIEHKFVLRGESGALDNYELTLGRYGDGQFSPRHHHNFDQFRFSLTGEMNFKPKEDIPQGGLCYFPEGAYYGPQAIASGTVALLIQFGGASGHGFMSYPDTVKGLAELKQQGEFERGVYRGSDAGGGRRNQDGYEAVWEHVNGRTIEYSTPRQSGPILIDPEAYPWSPVAGGKASGVRPLGVFNERGTAANMYRFAPDETCDVVANGRIRIFYVLSGQLQVDSSVWPADTGIELGRGEQSAFRAVGSAVPAVVLNFELPAF